jgi:Cys-rich protein (TIGR01571 family)
MEAKILYQKMSYFHESILGCFSDIPVCLTGMSGIGICILQARAVSKATGEGFCVPCLLVSFLGCFGGAINRKKLRDVYNIDGDLCIDILIWWRSSPCAACQEYREVKRRTGF